MSEPVISVERIKRQAIDASLRYTEVNAACPYPFGTEAARVFTAEFTRALRLRTAKAAQCECDLELCQQELDTGRCMACGKAVLA